MNVIKVFSYVGRPFLEPRHPQLIIVYRYSIQGLVADLFACSFQTVFSCFEERTYQAIGNYF